MNGTEILRPPPQPAPQGGWRAKVGSKQGDSDGLRRPPPQPAPQGGGRGEVVFPLIGLGILCVAIPVLRDVLLRQGPGSAHVVAGVAYVGLMAACLVAMRMAGISRAEVGVRAVSIRSVVIGLIAGVLVVAPVWRLPAISVSSAGWLVLAVAVEEVAFRGVLFAILRRLGGLPLAIVGSAAVFTVAHAGSVGWPSLVLIALAGLYLGLLRAMRGDLWASGMAHLLMDLVSLP
jgi:membrane protease YdiL (CAAX protease family)